METQNIINIGLILLMITGFTTVVILDEEGIELEPTHYCESRELNMYCVRTTDYYCYPKLDSRIGSKKCDEGWTEIPKEILPGKSNYIVCDSNGCTR